MTVVILSLPLAVFGGGAFQHDVDIAGSGISSEHMRAIDKATKAGMTIWRKML
jgi:hypothetical protein